MTVESRLIPYKQIVADDDFNARKVYEDIEGLAKQIKDETLLNPLIVREGGLDKKGEQLYGLIVGFRRHKAIGHLAKSDGESRYVTDLIAGVPCQVSDSDEDKEAYFVNLAENEARANLRPFELAERCKFLKDMYKMSGTEIGNRLGKTKGYINNLIYIVERLHPDIYAVFKTGHLSVIPAQEIASVEDKDEQWEIYLREYAKVPEDEEGDSRQSAAEPASRKKKSALRRPGEKRLLEALEAARRTGYKPSGSDSSWRHGLVLGLRYARGEVKVIPGVFPKPKKEEKPPKKGKRA